MVIQTISTHVIREALHWARIVPTRIQFWSDNPYRATATGSIIILVFERFSANGTTTREVDGDNAEVAKFLEDIRDSFAQDVKLIGWNYHPIYDQLKVYLQHQLEEEPTI